jgi:hypothetical protein
MLNKIDSDLKTLSEYKDGWDGYGAKAFTENVLDQAAAWSLYVIYQCVLHNAELTTVEIGPRSDGGVEIEFFFAPEVALILEVDKDFTSMSVLIGGRVESSSGQFSVRENIDYGLGALYYYLRKQPWE